MNGAFLPDGAVSPGTAPLLLICRIRFSANRLVASPGKLMCHFEEFQPAHFQCTVVEAYDMTWFRIGLVQGAGAPSQVVRLDVDSFYGDPSRPFYVLA